MIELHDLSIRSGTFALENVCLSAPAGAYAVLMGGTGQGKTTILEAICGLRPIRGGRIFVHGVDVTRLKPAERQIGYLPQDLALFPMMTVRQHLEFALRLRRASPDMTRRRVDELAELLGISSLLDRRVQGLSGGEAQRTALGRALAVPPRVLLLDEPLNALDEATRDRLCELLRRLQKSDGLTTMHVTHSRVEARQLADKLFVINHGRVIERPLSELNDDSTAPSLTAVTN